VSGSVHHLDESLALLDRAHRLRMGHPARGRICRAIAAATGLKAQHVGMQMNFCLETLVCHYKEVLSWQPLGHHSQFDGWDGLGMVFGLQFGMTGNIHDLNRAIYYGQMACTMLNPGILGRFATRATCPMLLEIDTKLQGIMLILSLHYVTRSVPSISHLLIKDQNS
jgi:hypothetical protein